MPSSCQITPGLPNRSESYKKGPTFHVGRPPREILPKVERSANPGRYTCLLLEWMQNANCSPRGSHRYRRCSHSATKWHVEGDLLRVTISYRPGTPLFPDWKEGFVLVWACESFTLYFYGREFELETDHKPLKHIYDTSSKPSVRLERCVLRLQGYNFKVIYPPGKTKIADALSRLNSMVWC